MFKTKQIGKGLVFYSDLVPELEHFFTTRDTNVEDNFDNICEYLNIAPYNLIHPIQTHSSNIAFVHEGENDYPDTDAVILTNEKQAVYMRFADCTPVILYDKKCNIAAVVHAGWRGTVAKIAPKTAKKMIEYSKSEPQNIYAIIGAAIGSCCYKVGEEVVSGIKDSVSAVEGIIFKKTDGIYVDLKSANKQQLLDIGVPAQNIDVCPFCTSCRNDLFYSYRKENGTDKRHNAVIKIK